MSTMAYDPDDDRWAARAAEVAQSGPQFRLRTVEFANPWHDEEGKFAPKGTGTTSPGGAVGTEPKMRLDVPLNEVGGIPVDSTSSTGVDTSSLAAEVVAGRDVTVSEADVDDVLLEFASADTPIDMTRITVEGSDNMFSQMRDNGMPRDQMPQIPVEKLGDFQAKLRAAGYELAPDTIDPTALKATQSELDGRKVGAIIRDLRAGEFDLTKDPLWVSEDGHVLDGHHRWAGAAAISSDCGGCITVPIIRVQTKMVDLLAFANAYNAEAGIEKQGFGAPGPHEAKKQAAAVSDPVEPPTVYGMATDAADGVLDEDLADLAHGDGSAFQPEAQAPATPPAEPGAPQFRLKSGPPKAPRVPWVDEFANPWHDHLGRFAPKGTGRLFIPGVGDVDEYLAAHPQEPGEAIFVWHGRLVDGLPPASKHALLFEIRERYAPVDYIAEGMRRWRAENGLPEPQQDISTIPANREKSHVVARLFEEMPDQAGDPRVQEAFTEFKRQNDEMWDFMTRPEDEGGLGIKVEFWTNPDPEQFGVGPYPDATAQAADLRENRHVFLEAGLGGQHQATMTQDEYDRFRAVHDVFGHAGIGGGFDRHGEYQAYLAHASMYTGDGRRAMASEYHGVNSAAWSGEPGTPGTGKSVLLPDELIENPWDDTGALRPVMSREELERFLPGGFPDDFAARRLLEQLNVDEDTAAAVSYLAERAGITHPFAQMYDHMPYHSHVADAA